MKFTSIDAFGGIRRNAVQNYDFLLQFSPLDLCFSPLFTFFQTKMWDKRTFLATFAPFLCEITDRNETITTTNSVSLPSMARKRFFM